jgi:D-alanyl-D-alanine carboxypeptidase
MKAVTQIFEWMDKLGIPQDYASTRSLQLVSECRDLISMGTDVFGREQLGHAETKKAWDAMKTAAYQDGVELDLVSAFRSIDYQASLIERKLVAGQTIEEILSVSAAPGFSEHHSGRALDITTPQTSPLESDFSETTAYRWLMENAHHFEFSESYGPNNPHGLIWEPWHWCHQRCLIFA